MVITIDGPSGAGKSSVSKRLAKELGFAYLDTGALYRAVALAAELAALAEEKDEPAVPAWLEGLDIEARSVGGVFEVLLEGRPVEPFIRNERIGRIASRLSALPEVRGFLLGLQRLAGQAGGLVAEGRDMGTVVFPGAEVKFFLTASDGERAVRRFLELRPHDPEITLQAVEAQLQERDQRDEERDLSPLHPAGDANIIDSSNLTLEEVVAAMKARVPQST